MYGGLFDEVILNAGAVRPIRIRDHQVAGIASGECAECGSDGIQIKHETRTSSVRRDRDRRPRPGHRELGRSLRRLSANEQN